MRGGWTRRLAPRHHNIRLALIGRFARFPPFAPALIFAVVRLPPSAFRKSTALAALLTASAAACGDSSDAPRDTVVVHVAASLAQPVRAAADSFARRTGAKVLIESGGSLEHARKLTELGRTPDVLLLADYEVFPQLLMPSHVAWYAQFARNRMVIAYTPRSRFASEISGENWREVLQRPGVEVGRPDPDRAPAGYRTLIALRLAEAYYGDPGLPARILARSPPRNMRGNAAELAGLLSLGEMDYIFEYESLARSHGFRYVTLPPGVDLSDPALAKRYAAVSVRVAARGPRDSVSFSGAPILYGLSIPRRAPHAAAAGRFVDYLLGEGRAVLRAAHVDLLGTPLVVPREYAGRSDLPASLREREHAPAGQ
jgi:molybdate/tungstate transport system substrate-binding protein